MQITVTPEASHYILHERKIAGVLRLALVKSGCSGFSFTLTGAAAPSTGDIAVVSNGVTIVVSQSDAADLDDTVIDVIKQFAGASLQISNPKFTSSCGCGKSFTKNP